MKNRSELREIIMKVLYQVFILEESGIDFDINALIKEQLEIENNFVKSRHSFLGAFLYNKGDVLWQKEYLKQNLEEET